MRELSELHYIIYLAGVHQTRESLTMKEKNAFYKLKKQEHLLKGIFRIGYKFESFLFTVFLQCESCSNR